MPRSLRIRPLPQNPSLEQLKKQAKELLDSLHQGDQAALHRFTRCFHVTEENRTTFKLTQAQLVLAREQGFPSWSQLAAWVTDRALPSTPAALVRLLGARTHRVRKAVAIRLEALGKAGVDAAIAGLSDPAPRVRYGAADFMDHHADEDCADTLRELALNDPVPYVRDMALHALGCQRCKPEPLDADLFPILAQVAKTDADWKARRGAVWSLMQLVPDPRVKEVLQYVVEHDPDPRVSSQARGGLRPGFRPGPAHLKEAKLRALAAKKRAERQAAMAA